MMSSFSELRPTRFMFLVNDPAFKDLNFSVVKAPLPDISVTAPLQNFGSVRLPVPQDRIDYAEISFDFIVSENMENYLKILNWIVENTYGVTENTYKDCSLQVLNSSNRVVRTINFRNAIPTSLTGIDFDTQRTDADTLKATLSLLYSHFEIE